MTNNPQWSRHLDSIADELMRLCIACDIRLRDAGVVERILRDDVTVCGRRNDLAFGKLRRLMMATFDSLGKAIDRLGPDETRKMTEAIIARVEQRRGAGGNT